MARIGLNTLIFLSGALAIYFQWTDQLTAYALFKPLTTSLIILLPIVYGNKEFKKYRLTIVVGLLFCLAGDALLLKQALFIYGLGSFLVAHLLFSYAFLSFGSRKYAVLPIVLLLVAAGAVYAFIFEGLGNLYLPVAAYILVIVFMCWQGISLALWKKNQAFLLMGVAAVLFIISDAFLAIDKFKHPSDFFGILILSTYWTSIALLANSTVYLKKHGV